MKKVDLDLVLVHKMQENDARAESIGDYLHSLLWTLWSEGEGFSSKRPFGNSDWESDLYAALVKGEFVDGEVDEDGYLDWCDKGGAKNLIFQCIGHAFKDWGNR